MSNGVIFANVDQDAEAWYCRTSGYFHSASSSCGESMRVRSSSSGIEAPALTSESNPKAPPSWSAYQYAGGTHEYGPAIFMPDGPVSAVAWGTAAAMMGSDQSSACKVSTYILAIAAGGALSLPIKNPITDGWFRSSRASLAIEARATFSSAVSHGSPPVLAQDSHLSQHSHPASIMSPTRSARS